MSTSDDKTGSKVRKKELKSKLKDAKKAAASSPSAQPPSNRTTPTPAERSAAAAERQVKLQSLRVWIALVAMTIALATLLVTAKPWERLRQPNEPSATSVDATTNGAG